MKEAKEDNTCLESEELEDEPVLLSGPEEEVEEEASTDLKKGKTASHKLRIIEMVDCTLDKVKRGVDKRSKDSPRTN